MASDTHIVTHPRPESMLKAMKAQGLLGEICGSLQDAEHSRPCDLLSLACVCQAFREPALDKLWARLPSYVPLLQLVSRKNVHDGLIVRLLAHFRDDL